MSTAANPRADQGSRADAPQEAGGAVTSDSLAAESIQSGGEFSKNTNTNELDVKGSNSTLNTTDTSGATALHPARDGAARETQDAKGLGSDERGHTGAKLDTLGDPNFTGTHSQEGYVGGPSGGSTGGSTNVAGQFSGDSGDSFANDSGSTGYKTSASGSSGSGSGAVSGSGSGSASGSGAQQTSTTTSSSGAADRYDADNDAPIRTGRAGEAFGTSSAYDDSTTAPNYAGTVSGAITHEGQYKPKGDNLTEGGIPETKTFTGNVGGSKDPGRLAEQDFNKLGSEDLVAAGGLKYAGSGKESSQGGQFDVLQSERAPDVNQ